MSERVGHLLVVAACLVSLLSTATAWGEIADSRFYAARVQRMGTLCFEVHARTKRTDPHVVVRGRC